jgi:hypothetical protein
VGVIDSDCPRIFCQEIIENTTEEIITYTSKQPPLLTTSYVSGGLHASLY